MIVFQHTRPKDRAKIAKRTTVRVVWQFQSTPAPHLTYRARTARRITKRTQHVVVKLQSTRPDKRISRTASTYSSTGLHSRAPAGASAMYSSASLFAVWLQSTRPREPRRLDCFDRRGRHRCFDLRTPAGQLLLRRDRHRHQGVSIPRLSWRERTRCNERVIKAMLLQSTRPPGLGRDLSRAESSYRPLHLSIHAQERDTAVSTSRARTGCSNPRAHGERDRRSARTSTRHAFPSTRL